MLEKGPRLRGGLSQNLRFAQGGCSPVTKNTGMIGKMRE